jgi:hypothetical protein
MIFEAVQRPRGNGAEQTAGAPWIRYRGAPHPPFCRLRAGLVGEPRKPI